MTNVMRQLVRGAIALLLLASGTLHLLQPDLFLAQVPGFLPFARAIVYVSGVVELLLGVSLFTRRFFTWAAFATALFFIVIFPGNIWQAVAQIDAFGLDTDARRIIRLAFQPLLIIGVLWSAKLPLFPPRMPRSDTVSV
jgi:uncharacterized membrane protein